MGVSIFVATNSIKMDCRGQILLSTTKSYNDMNSRVITSRLFATLLAAIVAIGGYAQDSYRDALKAYLSLSVKSVNSRMKTALMEMNETLFRQSEKVDLEQLTERYIKEGFVEQMCVTVEPLMKERNVTEADLRNVVALLSTPEGQAFSSHQEEWSTQYSDLLRDSFENGKAEKIPVNPDIDAEYAARFQKMWSASGIQEKTMGLLDGFLPDQMVEDIGNFGGMKTFINDNLGTVALNCAYGLLTLDDLDYGMQLFSNESYRKTNEASMIDKSFLGGMEKIADWMMGYIDWMESQGAQLSEKASGLKKLMNFEMLYPNE